MSVSRHIRVLALAAVFLPSAAIVANAEARYECAVVHSVPAETDYSDPVLKTELVLNGPSDFGFAVKHYTARGRVHQRGLQYREFRHVKSQEYDRWSGVWAKNPAVMMTGTLFEGVFNGHAQVRYVERLYRDARLERVVTSVCRPAFAHAKPLDPDAAPKETDIDVLRHLQQDKSCEGLTSEQCKRTRRRVMEILLGSKEAVDDAERRARALGLIQ